MPFRSTADPLASPRAGMAHAPGIVIRITPDRLAFPVSTAPAMPEIQVQAALAGVTPDPTAATPFRWTATLAFDARRCQSGVAAAAEYARLTGTAVGGAFRLRFAEIRGGTLTIRVTAEVGGRAYAGERADLAIVGTNPTWAQLAEALPTRVLRALVWHESRGRQFLGTADGGTGACPLYSGDRLGGVGLTQITRPAPSLDETWSWRANVARGIAILREKEGVARRYPERVRQSARFRQLVQQYNAGRQQRGQTPLELRLPEFTAEQLEMDTLRAYNGLAGNDGFVTPSVLHEFRVALDGGGNLVVDVQPDGRTGVVRWERVPAADRPRVGDPNYVDHVLHAQVPF